jgi:FkbM family methyltransferase
MKNLVYDIGGYDGSDTGHYLSLGYKVLCIEAQPDQAARIAERFKDHNGVTVLNVAVGPKAGTMPFYVHPYGELSSFDARKGSVKTEVLVRTLADIVSEYGIPHFMKVDIEGADRFAVLPLTKEMAPPYLSFEAGKRDLDLILHAHSIGYTRFNLIRQDNQSSVKIPILSVLWTARQKFRLWLRRQPRLHAIALAIRSSEAIGPVKVRRLPTSGPAPMERHDGWRDINAMVRDWSSLVASGMIETAWYDVHAIHGSYSESTTDLSRSATPRSHVGWRASGHASSAASAFAKRSGS